MSCKLKVVVSLLRKKTLRYSSTFQKELAGRPYLMVYNNLFKKNAANSHKNERFFFDEHNTF